MAPRVLVDATAAPADRGGVGRYVDGEPSTRPRPGAQAKEFTWAASAEAHLTSYERAARA
ncbi:hypothetical protein [Carbonactinospora thermoautotrophica]|uniref:hypothetical protein n=1 Tax=Carbonactinospora thermoautotrophica TaxID=1469144 RepID=UPI000B0336A7|nr:hypothetical protein [Carbonactinospora thermoautotrophica]